MASLIIKKSCKFFFTLLFFIFFQLLIYDAILAETTGSISGRVIDERTGEPLAATNVFIKGTTIGAATAPDGSFLIKNVPPGTYQLVASYLGFHTQGAEVNVVVGEVASVNFALEEDVIRGEEVIVTGIASKTARAVAPVAVSRVRASEYTAKQAYQSFSELVSGKIAGVTVKSSSGNPGAGYRFDVRSGGGLNGDEQPVIYIDGVRVNNDEVFPWFVGGQGISMLADLNPEDIEKIEFLKGPAGGASYGTNGSNGVVLITTKRGKTLSEAGRGVDINYKVTAGWNTQAVKYSTDDYISAEAANAIFRTGRIWQNSLSVAGGSNVLRYFASFENRQEEGITRNNELNRKNFRANLDIIPNDKLTFGVNLGYTLNDVQRPRNDVSTFGFLGNTLGFARPYIFIDSLSVEGIKDITQSNRIIASVNAEYSPFNNLAIRVGFGIDDQDLQGEQNFPVNLNYTGNEDFGERLTTNLRQKQNTYNWDVSYKYTPVADLNITSIAGAQLFDRRSQETFIGVFGFDTELITNIGAAEQIDFADEIFSHRREAGIFTQHSLTYRDQYFLTLNFRRDYASVIGIDAPSIYYPGVNFAIRLDKYPFFPATFELMKLRLAYGETGVLPDLLDGISLLYGALPFGSGVGAFLSSVGNPEIKPERIKEFEIGFDAELLRNWAVEFTYYRQKAKDSIVAIGNSPSTGKTASSVPFNVGEIKGWGVETLLQGTPIRTKDLELSLGLINNYQDNEVVDLGREEAIVDFFVANHITEGLAKHEFVLTPVLGAQFTPDGVYAGPRLGDESVPFGNPVPNYTGSFVLNLRFLKNFHLYVLTDWATGHKILNQLNTFAYQLGNNPRFNTLATQLGLNGSPIAPFSFPVPGVEPLTPGTPEYNAAADEFARLDWRFSANFIEDADFFKLRELSLSYSFKDVLPKIFSAAFKDLVIRFSGQNLWTAKKYSGPDPEVNVFGARDLTRGQDLATLQHPRVYNLTFVFSL